MKNMKNYRKRQAAMSAARSASARLVRFAIDAMDKYDPGMVRQTGKSQSMKLYLTSVAMAATAMTGMLSPAAKFLEPFRQHFNKKAFLHVNQ